MNSIRNHPKLKISACIALQIFISLNVQAVHGIGNRLQNQKANVTRNESNLIRGSNPNDGASFTSTNIKATRMVVTKELLQKHGAQLIRVKHGAHRSMVELDLQGRILHPRGFQVGSILSLGTDAWKTYTKSDVSQDKVFHIIIKVESLPNHRIRLILRELNFILDSESALARGQREGPVLSISHVLQPNKQLQLQDIRSPGFPNDMNQKLKLGAPQSVRFSEQEFFLRYCYGDGTQPNVCNLDLIGDLLSESLDVSKIIPGAEGALNVSVKLVASGDFSISEEKLSLNVLFVGEVAASITCNGICQTSGLLHGVIRVPNFFKLLISTDGHFTIPTLEGHTMYSEITIPWDAEFMAEGNGTVTLQQTFIVQLVAPGDPIYVFPVTPEGSLSIPTSSTTPLKGRGHFRVKPSVAMEFQRNNCLVRADISFTTGTNITIGENTDLTTSQNGTEPGHDCNGENRSVATFTPFICNLSTVLTSTTYVGWDGFNVLIEHPTAGKPLTVCSAT